VREVGELVVAELHSPDSDPQRPAVHVERGEAQVAGEEERVPVSVERARDERGPPPSA
jgi:hypothetical protein